MVAEKKLYELRIYTVVPHLFPDLLHLWENDGKILTRRYMKCIGVWNSETGHLNKIFHLYEWEGFSERESARQKFYNDEEAQDYVKKVKKLYQTQESYFLSSLDNLF